MRITAKNLELCAIEPNKPALGSYPDKALIILNNSLGSALRQTIVQPPEMKPQLRPLSIGPERDQEKKKYGAS